MIVGWTRSAQQEREQIEEEMVSWGPDLVVILDEFHANKGNRERDAK